MKARVLALGLLAALAASFSAHAQAGKPELLTEILYESDGYHAGGTARVALRAKLNKGFHVNSDKPLEEFLIPTRVTFELPDGVTLREIRYPEPIMLNQAGADDPLAVFEEEFVIGLAFDLAEGLAEGEHILTGGLRFQSCNDKACFAPETKELSLAINVVPATQAPNVQHADVFGAISFTGEASVSQIVTEVEEANPVVPVEAISTEALLAKLDEFTILGTEVYVSKAEFLSFIEDAEAGRIKEGWFEGKGPIAIIALVLVGGLALNLTPCVLPMIPINLAIIGAGAQAGSRTRGFLLGGTYGLAMAAVYGVLGLVVILTAGTFGTINASPWFNAGIAALFVVLALGMFDVINIDFSKYQAKMKLGQKGKGTFVLAFGMGSVAALLAGACVAPVVIQVIVFSSDLYSKGAAIALALPFLLGVGMALPWPFAGAGLSLMPKPGMWMVRVKQAFGVFIFGFAAYYGYLAYEIFDSRRVDSAEVAQGVEAMLEDGWYRSLSQGLDVAKEEDKLVLVDLWATWCKNCLKMDKLVLTDSAVRDRLSDYVLIKYQAEDATMSPTKEVMAHFDALGLPTYAILRPN